MSECREFFSHDISDILAFLISPRAYREGGIMSRHRIRKIIIGIIVLAAVVGAFLHLNVEPANYRDSLQKKIEAAEKIEEKAMVGNEEGQYSQFRVLQLQKQIDEAKETIANADLEYEDLKAYYDTFTKQIEEFEKNKNKEIITKEQIEKLIQSQETMAKEVVFIDDHSITWTIDGTKITNAAVINYGITEETLADKVLQQFLERLDVKGTAVTFLHNGSFPSTMNIEMDYTSNLKDMQIYPLNWKTNEFQSMIRGEVKENKLSFPIREGGTYLIIEKEISDDDTISDQINAALNDVWTTNESETSQLSPSEGITEDSQQTSQEVGIEPSKDSNPVVNQTDANAVGTTATKQNGVAATQAEGEENQDTSTPTNPQVNPPVVETVPVTQAPEIAKQYCTIEIRCDTIVDTSKLTNQAVAPYVPANGTILAETTVEIKEGDSAFDILRRITRNKGIQMEFREDPMYSGAKVEGINHIYEQDAGSGSGWMYKVNGWFPNYGSSQYKVKDGDKIVYCYTCDIGKDVGDQYYD